MAPLYRHSLEILVIAWAHNAIKQHVFWVRELDIK